MSSVPESFTILIVEDNPADQYLLEGMLLNSRLAIKQTYMASRLQEAIELLRQHAIDFVLLDLSLPDSFGIESLRSLRQINQRVPIIILTGLSDTAVALNALNQSAQDYLVKGEFNTGLLVKSIEYSFERKKIEERILASEEKYRQMFYKNPFPMWINEESSLQILEVNDAAIQKYGYSRDEFTRLTLNDIQVTGEPTLHQAMMGGVQEKRWMHRKKNGDIIFVDFTYYPINYFGKVAMQAQINDITEKVLLENEVTLQKQKMFEAVLNAQENERRVIGRELHDNINQILTAVKLSLDLALENKQNNEYFITNSQKNIAAVMDEVKKLSKELIIPSNIKELGIIHSVEDLMKEMLEHSGIKWVLSVDGIKENMLSEEHKLNIYRIVQEQLANILKHADASFISIQLSADNHQVKLVITDNGRGFDPSKKREGVGITNIISRTELFAGEVRFDTAPGKGCRLEVKLNTKKGGSSVGTPKSSPVPVN